MSVTTGTPESIHDCSSEEEARVVAVQNEVILFFVGLADRIGLPKSFGQIYGLLFCSSEPIPFEQVVQGTGMSKGSVSRGLRALEAMRAVKPVLQLNDRRTFYEAQTSFRKLLSSILEETVKPSLEENEASLERISSTIEDLDSEKARLIHRRLGSLRVWHQKVERLLPWVGKLTTPKKG